MNSPQRRLTALVPLLAFFLFASFLSGCYTALRHPGAPDLPEEYGYQDKSCYDCHDEAAFYHSYYGVYFDYYYDSPWFGYYSDPWWYDSYWGGGYGGRSRGVEYDSDERHQWKRGVPSGSFRGSSGSSSTAPYLRDDYMKKSSKPSEPPKQAEKPKEQKKESEKKRHTGRRGKKK